MRQFGLARSDGEFYIAQNLHRAVRQRKSHILYIVFLRLDFNCFFHGTENTRYP